VYFVVHDNAAWRRSFPVVKIGQTYDLGKRLSQLNTGSPVSLISAGVIKSSNPRRLESSLHAELAGYRLRMDCEWFNVNEDLIKRVSRFKIDSPRFSELFPNLNKNITLEQELAEAEKYKAWQWKMISKQNKEIYELKEKVLQLREIINNR
jgi:hypothetical protein